MIYLILFCTFLAFSEAQRPTYAGASPKGYPELASRFRDPADDQEIANSEIANRIGEDNQSSQRIPTDARGDNALVDRLNQWPRENRPFWLLNSEHIENQRNQVANNLQSNVQGQQNNQSRPLAGTQQQQQTGQIQARFGESTGSETITAKPSGERSSFAGNRP